MVNREQRNGESYIDYLRRLADEIDEYIYKLTRMILDEVPMCKELEGALAVFVGRKKRYEEELQEIKKDVVVYTVYDK